MNTLDDWPRVKRVLAGALEREGPARESFLDDACGSDRELRQRVRRLLAAGDRAGTFLEEPADLLLEPRFSEDLRGRVIDSYRLESPLGTGGTGLVYRAHDSRLDRPVAVKFLSPALVGDRDRVRRFHQEARAASSLNHPHIVVVHDFGELEGRPYLVTELIEGETLRQRLRRGPLAMSDVVDIGVQVAEALAAAHGRGLVHRDVKPENVMVRPDGYAKVLDFGLAKLARSPADAAGVESRTQTGVVLGTPRYMSPEQERGLDLDARTDVWSLGVVLYEMAAGALPFANEFTATEPDAGRDTPLLSSEGRHRGLPPGFLRIVEKALHSVRDLRYRDAGELWSDLKALQAAMASPHSAVTAPVGTSAAAGRTAWLRPKALALAAAVVLAALALVAIAWLRGSRGTPPAAVQKAIAVLPFENVGGDAEVEHLGLALADEVATALSWTTSLAVRPMASARTFAGGTVSPEQAGRELRVGDIVTGHFSAHRSELRVTIEAVEVEGNRLLWRETVTAPLADSIALRDRLTARILDGLLPALGAAPPTTTPSRPRNAEAYALYLKSLALATDPGPNRDAIDMLERASALDPDRASTWASLGQRYYDEAHYGGGGREALGRSEAALRQALSLDPTNTASAVQLMNLQVEAGRLQDGYDGAVTLVAQRPESAEAHFALSYVLRYGGRLEDSGRECEQAVARDPTGPRLRTCAIPFMLLGRYDRALDFVRLDSGSENSRLLTRFVYQRMGRRGDAREQHRELAPEYLGRIAPRSLEGLLTRCLSGNASDRQERLSDDDVKTFLTIRNDPEPLYFWASDLAYCGDQAAALRLLRESVRRNYCGATAIETDPMFASIRGRAEYGQLLGDAQTCRRRFSEHIRFRRSGG